MIGGGLLATGSSSCIIKPNISCKGKKTPRNNKKISKIVFGEKSKEYSESEKKIDDDKLVFLKVISNVIRSGMNIVGVETPEKM